MMQGKGATLPSLFVCKHHHSSSLLFQSSFSIKNPSVHPFPSFRCLFWSSSCSWVSFPCRSTGLYEFPHSSLSHLFPCRTLHTLQLSQSKCLTLKWEDGMSNLESMERLGTGAMAWDCTLAFIQFLQSLILHPDTDTDANIPTSHTSKSRRKEEEQKAMEKEMEMKERQKGDELAGNERMINLLRQILCAPPSAPAPHSHPSHAIDKHSRSDLSGAICTSEDVSVSREGPQTEVERPADKCSNDNVLRVLELGSGTGVVSVALGLLLSACGCQRPVLSQSQSGSQSESQCETESTLRRIDKIEIIASDRSPLLPLIDKNIEHNFPSLHSCRYSVASVSNSDHPPICRSKMKVDVKSFELDWANEDHLDRLYGHGQFNSSSRIDLVVCSELLYVWDGQSSAPPLARILSSIANRNRSSLLHLDGSRPHSQLCVLFAFEERSPLDAKGFQGFFEELESAGFQIQRIYEKNHFHPNSNSKFALFAFFFNES